MFVWEKVWVMVVLGIDNMKLKVIFGGLVDIFVEVWLVEEVVEWAVGLVKNGEKVFLLLVCVSFDLFKNYE